MAQPSQLDRTYFFILKRMVETGQAPFYTEIASEFGGFHGRGQEGTP